MFHHYHATRVVIQIPDDKCYVIQSTFAPRSCACASVELFNILDNVLSDGGDIS